MKLIEAREEFLVHLTDERMVSAHTVSLYARVVAEFADLAGDLPVIEISREHLRHFLVHLRDQRQNSPATLRTKAAALRCFFRMLLDQRHLACSPLHPEDFRFRVPRKLISVLTQDELNDLVAAVEKGPPPFRRRPRGRAASAEPHLRDRALLFLLAACGLRVGEAVGIDLGHVSRTRTAILVRGKGGDQREIYYDLKPLKTHFDAWLEERLSLGLLDGSLFVNFRDGRRMSTRSVQLMIKYYKKLAGIEKDVTPHTLRHTYATLSIENGANAKAVAQILGHRNIKTTINTYTHLSETHVRDVFRLCHPLGETRLPLEERVERRKRSLPLLS